MINEAHKQYVLTALRVIHECAAIDKEGNVSYTVKPGYDLAYQILSALVNSQQNSSIQASRCLDSTLKHFSKLDTLDLNEFIKLYKTELKNESRRVRKCFEVLRSVYIQLPVNLRSRKFLDTYIRLGKGNSLSPVPSSLPKNVKRAVKQRNKISELDNEKEHLPSYKEGDLFIAARVYANNSDIAHEKASSAINRYIALLNFITGFGHGNTWFSNPIQPQGVIIPSVYTTVHTGNGILLDEKIYYDPELTLVTPRGRMVKIEVARNIDKNLDFILRRIDKHFEKEVVLDGISLLGEFYTETNKNNAFLKCWMALERLMCFTPEESHKSMLKRMRFLHSKEFGQLEAGILEALRIRRNYITHHGFDISTEKDTFFSSSTSSLKHWVVHLIHFHIHLPKCIKCKEDFIQFTCLPINPKALIIREQLAKSMREYVS